jgi:hypothetical protein
MSGSFRPPRRGNDKTALGNAQGTMAGVHAHARAAAIRRCNVDRVDIHGQLPIIYLNGLAEFRDVQRIGDPYQPESPALMSGSFRPPRRGNDKTRARSAALSAGSCSFRPPRRGNDKTALGNAQGTMATAGPEALKGRNKVNRLFRPFRAGSGFGVYPTPRGVALGFHVEPRWGKIKNSATSKRARRVRIRRGHHRESALSIGLPESRKVI